MYPERCNERLKQLSGKLIICLVMAWFWRKMLIRFLILLFNLLELLLETPLVLAIKEQKLIRIHREVQLVALSLLAQENVTLNRGKSV